jgi:hypothetical protein
VIDDDQAQAILQQLSMAIQTIDSMLDNDNIGGGNLMHATTMTNARPYPPVNQQGLVDDHDRPHAEYSHLGNVYAFVSVLKRRLFIHWHTSHLGNPCGCRPDRSPLHAGRTRQVRLVRVSVRCHDVYLEQAVMDEIVRQFLIENIQYTCVAQESGPASGALHLHVQIILKYKANKKTWFLDHITGM